MRTIARFWVVLLLIPSSAIAQEASLETPLAKRLAGVAFEQYAPAPGYSEGPTWRNGEVFFCSGPLWRVDAGKKPHRYLEINPAGTVLKGDGHLLLCDNKSRAIVDLAPDGTARVVAERFEMDPLRSLNDLTIDARGNVYWTDPDSSSLKNPVGNVFRVRPDGRVDRVAGGLAFPNGLDVDPASKFLYVNESQSKKILRYPLPADNELCGPAEVFYDLGGSGGDGCAFDAEGNLWVADFHRPETGKGRITVLSPEAKVLAYLNVPAKVVSNIAFGGRNHDEIFCTTGDPPGVFHAKVGVKGFAGHPGKAMPVLRTLNAVAMKPHADAEALRKIAQKGEKGDAGIDDDIASLTDPKVRAEMKSFQQGVEEAIRRRDADRKLIAEVKRLRGSVVTEVVAPKWLREIAGDEGLPVFQRIVEIDLNENTDGHATPKARPLSERVTDDWLKNLAGQDLLRRLQLSGTAVTSAGLVYLKDLKNLEHLNVCLTAVDDRGFEHLAGLTKMKRMTVCSSKITGDGFKHLGGMKDIESINLHSSPASDAGLAAIGALKNLKRLEIVHTNVTDAGLAKLAGLTNLRQLHIHGPETTAAALPFLAGLTELDQLDVYDKAASNETLAEVGKLPKLRKLMLVNGRYDDKGVAHLAAVQTLEDVSLDARGVTDASVETLSKLRNLRTLHLRGTGITAAGRERLAKALPRALVGD